jgi:hypothetical protein
MNLRALLGVVALAGSAKAEGALPAESPAVDDFSSKSPVLPRTLLSQPRNYWVAGIALERFSTRNDSITALDHFLVGVTAMWRLGHFAPHSLLMITPSEGHENLRVLGGLGFRAYLDVPGFTELSAGFGTHLEARLKDHYWLGYITPIELGGTIVSNRTLDIELFVGVRRVIAGALINNFLIDPNGFDSEDARDNLEDERHGNAWKGFARVVFGRRLD